MYIYTCVCTYIAALSQPQRSGLAPMPTSGGHNPDKTTETRSVLGLTLTHLQSLPYCNTIARPLRNIRPPTDPPFLCHTPYTIGDGNIV